MFFKILLIKKQKDYCRHCIMLEHSKKNLMESGLLKRRLLLCSAPKCV